MLFIIYVLKLSMVICVKHTTYCVSLFFFYPRVKIPSFANMRERENERESESVTILLHSMHLFLNEFIVACTCSYTLVSWTWRNIITLWYIWEAITSKIDNYFDYKTIWHNSCKAVWTVKGPVNTLHLLSLFSLFDLCQLIELILWFFR